MTWYTKKKRHVISNPAFAHIFNHILDYNFLDVVSHLSTGLHTQKAYTHIGKIIRQFDTVCSCHDPDKCM